MNPSSLMLTSGSAADQLAAARTSPQIVEACALCRAFLSASQSRDDAVDAALAAAVLQQLKLLLSPGLSVAAVAAAAELLAALLLAADAEFVAAVVAAGGPQLLAAALRRRLPDCTSSGAPAPQRAHAAGAAEALLHCVALLAGDSPRHSESHSGARLALAVGGALQPIAMALGGAVTAGAEEAPKEYMRGCRFWAVSALRNLARESKLREAVLGAGVLAPLLGILSAPMAGEEEGGDPPPSSEGAGGGRVWQELPLRTRLRACVCEALTNLSCSDRNKEQIVGDGRALAALVAALRLPSAHAREAAVNALGCLSSFCPEAQIQLGELGALPLLQPCVAAVGAHGPLAIAMREGALSLLMNAALIDQNREALYTVNGGAVISSVVACVHAEQTDDPLDGDVDGGGSQSPLEVQASAVRLLSLLVKQAGPDERRALQELGVLQAFGAFLREEREREAELLRQRSGLRLNFMTSFVNAAGAAMGGGQGVAQAMGGATAPRRRGAADYAREAVQALSESGDLASALLADGAAAAPGRSGGGVFLPPGSAQAQEAALLAVPGVVHVLAIPTALQSAQTAAGRENGDL